MEEKKTKKPFYKRRWFIAIVVFFLIGVIGLIFETDEQKAERIAKQEQREKEREERRQERKEKRAEKKKEREEKKAAEEKKKSEEKAKKEDKKKQDKKKEDKKKEDKKKEVKKEKKKLTPEEDLNKRFADISHGELLDIGGVFDEEPFSMQVNYLGSENLTKNMTVQGMKISILDAVYIAKESGYEIESLGINMKYPLVDQYGNTEDEYVIKSTFSKETLEKLSDDKGKVNKDNLGTIADSWWEHPAISK